jgi:DnaK suppressor protein
VRDPELQLADVRLRGQGDPAEPDGLHARPRTVSSGGSKGRSAGLGTDDDSEEADELDPGNLASDLYQDELDEGLGEDLREQLATLERAEQRLADGTYGLSIESGEPIPDDRLEVIPVAELTGKRSGLARSTDAGLSTSSPIVPSPRSLQPRARVRARAREPVADQRQPVRGNRSGGSRSGLLPRSLRPREQERARDDGGEREHAQAAEDAGRHRLVEDDRPGGDRERVREQRREAGDG